MYFFPFSCACGTSKCRNFENRVGSLEFFLILSLKAWTLALLACPEGYLQQSLLNITINLSWNLVEFGNSAPPERDFLILNYLNLLKLKCIVPYLYFSLWFTSNLYGPTLRYLVNNFTSLSLYLCFQFIYQNYVNEESSFVPFHKSNIYA